LNGSLFVLLNIINQVL